MKESAGSKILTTWMSIGGELWIVMLMFYLWQTRMIHWDVRLFFQTRLNSVLVSGFFSFSFLCRRRAAADMDWSAAPAQEEGATTQSLEVSAQEAPAGGRELQLEGHWSAAPAP